MISVVYILISKLFWIIIHLDILKPEILFRSKKGPLGAVFIAEGLTGD